MLAVKYMNKGEFKRNDFKMKSMSKEMNRLLFDLKDMKKKVGIMGARVESTRYVTTLINYSK